jgi:hypothetical protein
MAAAVEHRDGEIERLKPIIKKLQRAQFGRRSERLDPYQLRSRSKRATATLPARKRSVRVAKSKQTNGPLDASRRPAICRAKKSASILRA